MNWDQVQGNWEQLKGQVKEKWGKLTDNDLLAIRGQKDQLAGKLQERYGYAKDRVEKEIEKFASACDSKNKSPQKDMKKDGGCCSH